MEKMPYRADLALLGAEPAIDETASSDWRQQLPVLTGRQVRLRELRPSDASSLFAMLTTEEVSRFISPPPTTVEGFERFITWAIHQRAAGDYVCFAVTVHGFDTAVGIFQVRRLDSTFDTAEWGFALGSEFWGTDAFKEGAELVLDFVFNTVGAHRLEARAAVQNGRGNGALQKVGAVQEAILRKSFLCRGEFLDQALYTVIAEEWRTSRGATHRRSAGRAQIH